MAHVGAATLAALWREGAPFPAHGEPLWQGDWKRVLSRGPYEAIPLHGNRYVRFRCRACGSSLFVANTCRGIRHAIRVATGHQGACCKERREWFEAHGVETAWPDDEVEDR